MMVIFRGFKLQFFTLIIIVINNNFCGDLFVSHLSGNKFRIFKSNTKLREIEAHKK